MAEESKLEKYQDMMNSASVIKGMAEILIEDEVISARKDMLSTIRERAERVAEQLSTSKGLEK